MSPAVAWFDPSIVKGIEAELVATLGDLAWCRIEAVGAVNRSTRDTGPKIWWTASPAENSHFKRPIPVEAGWDANSAGR